MTRLENLKSMNGRKTKIYVAGSTGMVGSAIKRHLEHSGYTNLIGKTSKELNLINQTDVESFFSQEKPRIVILSAGKVGGVLANDAYRAEFIYNNLMIEANVIHAAHKHRVENLFSSVVHASTRNSRRNRSKKKNCSQDISNRPTSLMRLRKLLE
jgi:GDP-L-fucose synthase